MGKIIFISGGARSGKSQYAIALAGKKKSKKVAFIATCQPLDTEMARRIRIHKDARPANWETFEEPQGVAGLVKKIGNKFDWIVIDCLTLLVSNLLLKKFTGKAIENEFNNILIALKKCKADFIIVSNEVGLGIVPGNKLARDFRDIAGRINQLAAKKADEVHFMVSGIPWRIK